MKKFVIAAVAACGLAMGITVSAEEEPADENDIGTVSCRDILMASGEDRDGAVLVLHGYVLGEKSSSNTTLTCCL